MNKLYPGLAAIWAMVAVVLGAMGSHTLSKVFDAQQLASWSTAVDYHLFHSLGVIALSGLCNYVEGKHLNQAARFLLVGSVFFSGSIYLLTAFGPPEGIWRQLGFITPVGGAFMILGWGMVGYRILKRNQRNL